MGEKGLIFKGIQITCVPNIEYKGLGLDANGFEFSK